jgi:hypothetical protein
MPPGTGTIIVAAGQTSALSTGKKALKSSRRYGIITTPNNLFLILYALDQHYVDRRRIIVNINLLWMKRNMRNMKNILA